MSNSKKHELRKYSPEELDEQKRAILLILEKANPKQLKILEKAESDKNLHPQIKALIERCREIHTILTTGNNCKSMKQFFIKGSGRVEAKKRSD